MPRIKTDDAAKSNDQGRHYTPVLRAAPSQLRDVLSFASLMTSETARIEGRTAQVGLARAATPLAGEAVAPCVECHSENAAVERTFVQFYPHLLEVAREKGTLKPGH